MTIHVSLNSNTKIGMNCEDIYDFCRALPEAEETFPFDETSLVMKVRGKMFALIPLDNPVSISVKCEPERAVELREQYAGITPAYHFNKKHWNSMDLTGTVPKRLLQELIVNSYNLVVTSLPRAIRTGLRPIKY